MNKEESEAKTKEIKLKRGYVATNFAYIEFLIANAISYHYFQKLNEEFITEVFEDRYFNVGLLLNIFEKVLKRKKIQDFPIGKLKELEKLRNIIIHSKTISYSTVVGSAQIKEIIEIKFRHGGQNLDIQPIFDKYDSIEKEIRQEFQEHKELGVKETPLGF